VSDFHVHSFDAPRQRATPSVLNGRALNGEVVTVEFVGRTLIVAVKPHCDGCREFIHGDLSDLTSVQVVLVSATVGDQEWADAPRSIVVAPEFMTELEIRSAPYYVLIDPANSSVLGEGTLFSPAQVAHEIAPFLTP
jgi:hypothetical protein